MKSAIEVIANVQSVRVLAVIGVLLLYICDQSLTTSVEIEE